MTNFPRIESLGLDIRIIPPEVSYAGMYYINLPQLESLLEKGVRVRNNGYRGWSQMGHFDDTREAVLIGVKEIEKKPYVKHEPTFREHSEQNGGPTKREYFAAMAMQGLLSHPDVMARAFVNDGTTVEYEAVRQADALIAELKKDTP